MIYVFLADGFEEIEALAPVDLLRRAGCDVTTVGVTGSVVTGSHGVSVRADADEALLSDAEMIILPGGQPGADNLRASKAVTDAVMYCYENGWHIAAICAAPYILGELGMLNGVRAVCFPGYEDRLSGAVLSPNPVVTDGRITTARSAGHAVDFGLELVRVLKGDEASEKLRSTIM